MRAAGTTLACVDCAHVKLAVRALEKSLEQCEFDAVKLFTDDASAIVPRPRIELVPIPRVASAPEYSRFMLKDLVRHIDTPFVQVVQWDGYIVHGKAWTEEFQQYDYIGARWWFREEGRNVGNGGFSLRSRKLLEALQDDRVQATDAEDNVICLEHRSWLEQRGIRFAPSAVADRYSFEGERPTLREFGFHRLFNLPYFNDAGDLASILDSLTDEEFACAAAVTLVETLVRLRRMREARKYANRIRADSLRFASLPARFRANLEGILALLERA